MGSFLQRLNFLGLDFLPDYSNQQKRIQRLFAIIFFLVISLPVFIIHDFIQAVLKIQPYNFEHLPLIIFYVSCLLSLYFAKREKFLWSKLIIIFAPLMFISSYSLIGFVIGEHFLWQPIAVLGISVIPILVLDVTKEVGWLIFSFLVFLLYTIFHTDILLYGSDPGFAKDFERLDTTPFVYNGVRILIFLFLSSIIYYSIRMNDHQQLVNAAINNSLKQTSDHLALANAELQAQRNAINNSASLLIVDDKLMVVSANENFLAISGFEKEDLTGMSLWNLVSNHYTKDYVAAISDALHIGQVWRGELNYQGVQAENFWMETAISPIFEEGNRQKGYLVLMFNITKLKKDERRLEKLNEEKDRIFYAVAHDLKGPLLNFKTLLNMIISGIVKKDEEEHVLKLMTKDCDHSINLISELFEIGRLENEGFVLKKTATDLNALIENSRNHFDEQAKSKNIELTTSLDADIKSVDLNATEFDHVTINLISNALKFTPAGGTIKISSVRKADKAVIEISDNGIGISPESLPSIFDKFSKAGRKGLQGEKSTGLGLWIVKRIVNLHSGEISVQSLAGKGTTFTITLPIKAD